MATWAGTLNTNEIFTSLRNMIIGQQVFSDNIGRTFTSLVDRARVDGTLYGDTYLYYSTDALETKLFDPDDSTQANVLALSRPDDPYVQAISIDTFRFIEVTIDNYFTKRAFSTETAFADFNSVTLQWLRDTKKIYDATTYNAFVGTEVSAVGSQTQEVDLTGITASASTADDEAMNRLVAETIAQKIADILVDMKDIGTGYNDLGYYRAFDPEDLVIVWNADWVNLINKVDLPTIFHKDGLVDISMENVLPAKYFGTRASATTTAAGAKALNEMTISGTHYWAGETVATGSTVTAYSTYTPTPAVMTDESVICKIMHKKSIPYMSGFQTETEFINPKNLSENHYLIFGHNTLAHLVNYPIVTVKAGL